MSIKERTETPSKNEQYSKNPTETRLPRGRGSKWYLMLQGVKKSNEKILDVSVGRTLLPRREASVEAATRCKECPGAKITSARQVLGSWARRW